MGAPGRRPDAFRRNLVVMAPGVALAVASVPRAFSDANDNATTTPIKHLIVIIGENRQGNRLK